ncbi:MAG TPA: cupin-like domain-containing protein [Polyangiaceae bacterium]|jgi:hypothetical protein|nr:cupin-like domain-containing protein [Polyangiaceae bacterium]
MEFETGLDMRDAPNGGAPARHGEPRVGLTRASYDDTRPGTFAHGLSGHPLMTLGSLAELALRRPANRVRVYDADTVTAGESIELVADKHGTARSLEEMVRAIEDNRTYLFIMNVETDPVYGPLVRELLEEMKQSLRAHGQQMTRGWAWVFISAPNTVTPYHRDHEQTCLFQLQGQKVVHTWNAHDTEVCSVDENEHFHSQWSLSKTVLKPEYAGRDRPFALEPGQALYIPFSAPHWVQNGPATSVSFSVTFATDKTDSIENAHKMNAMLRRRGLSPKPIGTSKLRDAAKDRAFRGIEHVRGILRRGRPGPSTTRY